MHPFGRPLVERGAGRSSVWLEEAEWESGVVVEGIAVARYGSRNACDRRLGSRCAFALEAESETRCGHASESCGRLESFGGGGLAICCGTSALFSP